MKTPEQEGELPVYVEKITAELRPGAWQPESLQEFLELQETTIFLEAWREQQKSERGLRKMIGIWVFCLISIQIFAIFGVVIWDGGQRKLDASLVKFLIPSVLGEVFGMGFIVVKYLFRLTDLAPFTKGKKK
jgi:hypothetical protein